MNDINMTSATLENKKALRRGWTTGACATAATKAAYIGLVSGAIPDPVTIQLPKGEQPAFVLAREAIEANSVTCGIIKDAGDDPDVTHGALILATVSWASRGTGIHFRAGVGVGTVTKAGLPIAVGEAAINPVPRQMMTDVIEQLAGEYDSVSDVVLTISVEDGAALAEKTWNPRLGIIGGLSILGTTGIVHPFSCSAWIHSIHRGVDVAIAEGLKHLVGATGSTSEASAQNHFQLTNQSMIDMGDFAGGLLKYVRNHPVDHLTIAGGFAKMVKLARGNMDLHSARSQVDFEWLAEQVHQLGGDDALIADVRASNTALETLTLCQAANIDIASAIATRATDVGRQTLRQAPVGFSVLVIERSGRILAVSDPL
jgi:cobalt-precorrin-5B (C1)-methyltransferase